PLVPLGPLPWWQAADAQEATPSQRKPGARSAGAAAATAGRGRMPYRPAATAATSSNPARHRRTDLFDHAMQTPDRTGAPPLALSDRVHDRTAAIAVKDRLGAGADGKACKSRTERAGGRTGPGGRRGKPFRTSTPCRTA